MVIKLQGVNISCCRGCVVIGECYIKLCVYCYGWNGNFEYVIGVQNFGKCQFCMGDGYVIVGQVVGRDVQVYYGCNGWGCRNGDVIVQKWSVFFFGYVGYRNFVCNGQNNWLGRQVGFGIVFFWYGWQCVVCIVVI